MSLRFSFPQRHAVVQLSRCKMIFSDSLSSSESNTDVFSLHPAAVSKPIVHCDSCLNDYPLKSSLPLFQHTRGISLFEFLILLSTSLLSSSSLLFLKVPR